MTNALALLVGDAALTAGAVVRQAGPSTMELYADIAQPSD